jgi:hypothetical protein
MAIEGVVTADTSLKAGNVVVSFSLLVNGSDAAVSTDKDSAAIAELLDKATLDFGVKGVGAFVNLAKLPECDTAAGKSVPIKIELSTSFTEGKADTTITSSAKCPEKAETIPLQTYQLTFGADGFVDLDGEKAYKKDLTADQAKTVDIIYGWATGNNADKIFSSAAAEVTLPDAFIEFDDSDYTASSILLLKEAYQTSAIGAIKAATSYNDIKTFLDGIGGDFTAVADKVEEVDVSGVTKTTPVAFVVYTTETLASGQQSMKFVIVEDMNNTQKTLTIKSIGAEGM